MKMSGPALEVSTCGERTFERDSDTWLVVAEEMERAACQMTFRTERIKHMIVRDDLSRQVEVRTHELSLGKGLHHFFCHGYSRSVVNLLSPLPPLHLACRHTTSFRCVLVSTSNSLL